LSRTFGWIQDPGKFENLRRVVEVFFYDSKTNKELRLKIIPNLVEARDGRDKFINELSKQEIILTYSDLTGTSFTPRSSARCNGIIQAAIKGQRRPFISDWPADNFIRWAHALGFIEYIPKVDSFKITPIGIEYVQTKEESSEEYDILENAFLSYPPAVRILNLLSEGVVLTKFEIGGKLGFVGENGFTSLPQHILIKELALTEELSEKNKMKTDWEGSCDKYARMICGWLQKVGWVSQVGKEITVTINKEIYKEIIPHAYVITSKGLKARRGGLGLSKVKTIRKNIFWEMLATKTPDRDYIRTRRALILNELKRGYFSANQIKEKLMKNKDIFEDEFTILDDIEGFINIGINITKTSSSGELKFKLSDDIIDLLIPENVKEIKKEDKISLLKDKCRPLLNNVSRDFLSIIDIAYDSTQNRYFEMKTIQLLIDECGFDGEHLGGSRKPDGIIYADNYGLIIDTKAYSQGYTLPISQADEMSRYIEENKTRDEIINKNKWWEKFPKSINLFNYLFVSSEFKGRIKEQLQRISNVTNTNGGAINAFNLLLLAEKIKGDKLSGNTLDLNALIGINDEIILESQD
jgi:hypothetical protein